MTPLVRRPLARRLVGHTLGLIVAVLIAWLIFRGYRQPELLLDLANMRLC
jgi:predicted lipase